MISFEDDIVIKGINNRYDKIARLTCEADPYRRVWSWKIITSDAVC